VDVLVWPFSARRGSTRGRDKVRVRGNVFGPIDPLAAPSGNDRYLRIPAEEPCRHSEQPLALDPRERAA
jgi:hypothetical protein